MLRHWTVTLEADPKLYIPFSGDYPGSERGKHKLNMGLDYPTEEEHVTRVIEWAKNVFPEATITAVYETNVLADLDSRRLVWTPHD